MTICDWWLLFGMSEMIDWYQIINELKILLPIPIKMTIQSWFEIPCMHSWFEKDWDCKISEDFNSFIKSFPKSIFICKVAWASQMKLQNFQKYLTNLLFLSSEQMKWKDLKMIWWKSNHWLWVANPNQFCCDWEFPSFKSQSWCDWEWKIVKSDLIPNSASYFKDGCYWCHWLYLDCAHH